MKYECYTENANSFENFNLVRDFLKELVFDKLFENWHWARWGWMIDHPNFEDKMLNMIGLWKEDKEIVGIATHDMRMGEVYLIYKTQNSKLLDAMVDFAEKNIANDDCLFVIVNDDNNVQSALLRDLGYSKTHRQEVILEYDYKNENLNYTLTDGFIVTSFKEEKEINKFMKVLWKGFENEGEPPILDKDYNRPLRQNWKEELSVFVKAPGDEYVAYCGMWYDEGEKTAYIEPVCTVPEYRNRGLAKIAVYEAMKRCKKLGAERAIVISNQPFYFKIGFKVSSSYSFWRSTRR